MNLKEFFFWTNTIKEWKPLLKEEKFKRGNPENPKILA